MARVLVVEADAAWADAVADALGRDGHDAACVVGGAAARAAVGAGPPDLVVLGLDLPDEDGLVLLLDLKALAPGTPVLVCSASRRRADRLLAIRVGDGFAARPCDPEEVAARAGALLRRAKPAAPAEPPGPRAVGALRVDPARPEARAGGAAVALTRGEHRLLLALAERAGEAIPLPALTERVYGDAGAAPARGLPMLARRLRAKLAALGRVAELHTVRGSGFRLVPADDATGGPQNPR